MSGTRFARTGRCRFLVCFGILLLMVGMVAIFHSSQIQLDKTREQHLHCEQQQEALNERLTTLVEQKYHLEKSQERERGVQLETKRNLEQKIKELEEKYQKEEVEQQMRYDKLKQAHSILQSDHKHLKQETQKANKQQLDNINSLEKKLQSIRSELQKEKSNISAELIEWREKYNIADNENKRLHNLVLIANQQDRDRIKELEDAIKDYNSHCEYKVIENLRKPVAPRPDMTNIITSKKSFKQQDSVSEGVYHISINITNSNKQNENKMVNGTRVTSSNEPPNAHIVPKTIKQSQDEQQQQEKPNRLLSVEVDKNQVAPLSAPKSKVQLSSTTMPKSGQQQMQAAAAVNATSANVRTVRGSSTSSSNSPPLALPPNQRKLPENVAPIPENFEDLFQKSHNENQKEIDHPSNLDEKINNDLNKSKFVKPAINSNINNYDSGAHEIKDVAAEGDSNNAQNEDDINNFFDNDQDTKDLNKNNNKNVNEDKDDDGGNDDDNGAIGGDNDGGDGLLGGAAAGDIAVKNNQQQLLDDSLRNEIADDQGKEFGDGLRLDEGAMEEDDDDDYSNPSARKHAGDQVVRN